VISRHATTIRLFTIDSTEAVPSCAYRSAGLEEGIAEPFERRAMPTTGIGNVGSSRDPATMADTVTLPPRS